MSHFDATQPVADIVRLRPGATAAFQRFGIDYCCGGRASLHAACEIAGAQLDEVLRALDDVPVATTSAPAFERLGELVDHLVATHHVFTRDAVARLVPLAARVARVHGAAHPELADVERHTVALADDLIPHLQKEELVLFPYARALEAPGAAPAAPFGSIVRPIACMRDEHEHVDALLRELRRVTSGYALPEGACGSYRALFAGLAELEADLHQHIHLENNVLFPAAAELEAARAPG
jgi:regulator of cell morphogenesis and NO signaling